LLRKITPTGVLKQNKIVFKPNLPQNKLEAINSFQMLPATKLIYGFKERLWDDNLTYMAHVGLAARWWTPSYNRNSSTHFISCYITAENARIIDELPLQEALETGLKTLSLLLGRNWEDLKSSCVLSRRVSWDKEPFTRGGYASLPAHCSGSREVLAEPVSERLYFAGEATAYHSNPQTVHGALESGIFAAKYVAKYLNKL
jgi:monoamine oxidase